MRHTNLFPLRTGLFALLACLLALPAVGQIGPGPFAAFPTADETDGQFLGFSCPGLNSFEEGISVGVEVPVGESDFTLSIFDGDTGGVDASNRKHWDLGTRQLIYRIYADPFQTANTDPANLVGQWSGNAANPLSGPGWTATAAQMPDNDWWGVTVDTTAAAQSPSGNYNFHIRVEADGACASGEQLESNLKIAASNPLSFLIPRFALVGGYRQGGNDAAILYPQGIPPGETLLTAPTTYDGVFSFFLNLNQNQTDLSIFDGDFDHGLQSGFTTTIPSGLAMTPCADTDDPNTPADYADFPFTPSGARPEGAILTPSPPDDNPSDLFRRGEPDDPARLGCIRYEAISPGGSVFRNDNPSGGQEWEEFRIAGQVAVDPGLADYTVGTDYLEPGIWQVRIVGQDLANLNFLFVEAGACSMVDGTPACPTGAVFLVGDTVWLDADGDGVQDGGESGVSGVVVELYDDSGPEPVATAVTGDSSSPNWANCVANNTGLDTDGLYCFGVPAAGDYSVVVAASNFEPGGALEGLQSTTGGEQQDDTVVEANVLTYDFGYLAPFGSVGDRVWYDADGDGEQDGGETGLNGVTVRLLDGDGNEIDSQVTSGDGEYLFEELEAGDYTVEVDASTLPADLAQTYDLDGLVTANRASFSLGQAEDRRDVDFGYDDCAPCDGKVTRLTLQYLGSSSAWVEVKAKRGGKHDVVFEGNLDPSDSFEMIGPPDHRGGFDGTLGTDIKIYVDGDFHTSIHTSCSQPIGPGTVSGDFLVVSGESRNGGLLCPEGGGCTDCSGGECPPDLDFETDGDGHPLEAGTVVDDEWADLGIHVTTDDPHRHPAMIFDSAHPTGGDPDLGTPNRDFGGPGRGDGGEAGEPYANDAALGKILIISEDGHHWDPDDNNRGGKLIFTFDEPVDVSSLGFIDIEKSGSYVKAYDGDGNQVASASIPTTGDNGVTTVALNATGVSRLEVKFKGSGGLTGIVFCPEDGEPEPGPEPDVCPPDLDFETGDDGQALQTGEYVEDQWASLGIRVTTHDPRRHPAMIFDSSQPTGGDDDLGTPNEEFGGPGRGRGGEDGQFANTTAEGKVLIISEDGRWWAPDDNRRGGWILFTFDDPVSVASVSLVDVENRHSEVRAYDADWQPIAIEEIPHTGDNGVVTVDVGASGVTYLKVRLKGSGAVSRIRFCEDDGGGGDENSIVGTGTIGYWKNHPEAWPVDSVTVGPYHLAKDQGLQLLQGPSYGNLVVLLAQQLVATKLNLAAGTESNCIQDVVDAADRFIDDNPPSSWLRWKERREAEDLKDQLDGYNNGTMCALSRG